MQGLVMSKQRLAVTWLQDRINTSEAASFLAYTLTVLTFLQFQKVQLCDVGQSNLAINLEERPADRCQDWSFGNSRRGVSGFWNVVQRYCPFIKAVCKS